MRTTIRLDPDIAAAAEQLRRDRHIGLGAAVNELARAGLGREVTAARFEQRTASAGIRIDVADVAEALELLDEVDEDTAR